MQATWGRWKRRDTKNSKDIMNERPLFRSWVHFSRLTDTAPENRHRRRLYRRRCPPATLRRPAGEESDRRDRPGLPASGRSRAPGGVTISAGRGPTSPERQSPQQHPAALGKAPIYLPSFRGDARSRVVRPSLPRSADRAVRAAPGPHAASPRARPRAGEVALTLGLQLSSGAFGNRKEVGRGCDAGAANTRRGPPGVVRTPPAAAVRPLPRIRRPTPVRRFVPDGRRRARFGRVSLIARITACPGALPTRATHTSSPSRTRCASDLRC